MNAQFLRLNGPLWVCDFKQYECFAINLTIFLYTCNMKLLHKTAFLCKRKNVFRGNLIIKMARNEARGICNFSYNAVPSFLCLFFIKQIPKVGEKFTFVRFTQWCILSQHVEWEIFRNCYKKSYLLGKIWHLNFLQTSVFYFSHF